MNKKNKSLLIILLVLCVGLVGLTIAYFSNSTSIENEFSTNPYGTTIEEIFTSPDNWLPGTTTDKTITVTNSGLVDEAVRISYAEKWVAKDGTILSGLIDSNGNLTNNTENSEHAAIINFSDNGDFTYSNGYYYYNYRLAPNETTSSLIDSVTFNSKVKNSDDCVTNDNNGVKTITCNTTESGYDGATYTLTFNIETIQYNKYKEAWGVDIATSSMRPMTAQQFISKANPVSVTNYTDGDVHEMYTFEHEATEQTPALTDYRYIGNDPYNYVYFNCDSLDYQSEETCEVWRIIGVFDVEDEDGNWETRYKIVRSDSLNGEIAWDSNNVNDWSKSSSNRYLNNSYYNSLKASAKKMIGEEKYYLGGTYDYAITSDNVTGTTSDIYTWERGTSVYNLDFFCNHFSWASEQQECQMDFCENNPTNSYCINRAINDVQKIALLYPSDNYYIYGKGVSNICYNNPMHCSSSDRNLGWFYNIAQEYMYFISPRVEYPEMVFLSSLGTLSNSTSAKNTVTKIRPTLYLKSNVKLVDGNGSEQNPYKLGYDSSSGGYIIYTKGQTVTYDNQEYYVMNDSEGNKSYVKLLKKEPLTSSEINAYNTSYTSTNGEYPYLENSSCTNGNTINCSTNYDTSNIKSIIDNWSSNYNNDLVSINGYKARLVNENDISNNFSYENYVSGTDSRIQTTSDTPSWVIINGKSYWSMYNSSDSNTRVYGVSNTLSSENVYNKLYIRPVINLKKCAITNTCE